MTDTFGDRVISKKAAIMWPPSSPDLAPNDYSFWGRAQDYMYHRRPQTFEELKQALIDFIETFNEDDIRRMVQNIRRRAKLCLNYCDGGTFEHLIKKKNINEDGDNNDDSSSSSSSDEEESEDSEDQEDDDDDDKEPMEESDITSSIEITSNIAEESSDSEPEVSPNALRPQTTGSDDDDNDRDNRSLYQSYGLKSTGSHSDKAKARKARLARITENAKETQLFSPRRVRFADYGSDSDSE